MQEIIIYRSSAKQIKYSIFSIVSIALFAITLIISPFFIKIISALALLVLVPGFVLLVKQWRRSRAILTISEGGFSDHTHISGTGFVPWGNVERIFTYRIRKDVILTIELLDVDYLLLSGFPKGALKFNRDSGFPCLTISTAYADRPAEEIFNIMQDYLRLHRESRGILQPGQEETTGDDTENQDSDSNS